MNYVVIDSTNHVVRYFKTYQEAECFIIVNNRLDWKIISYFKADYKPTAKQQSAVKWTSYILGIRFTGDINSGLSCSEFLSQYLESAKQHYLELKSEYEADRGY
jgi:hypothetical protein